MAASMTDSDGNGVVSSLAADASPGRVTMATQDPSGASMAGPAAAMDRALGATLGTTTSGTVANRPAITRRLTTG